MGSQLFYAVLALLRLALFQTMAERGRVLYLGLALSAAHSPLPDIFSFRGVLGVLGLPALLVRCLYQVLVFSLYALERLLNPKTLVATRRMGI